MPEPERTGDGLGDPDAVAAGSPGHPRCSPSLNAVTPPAWRASFTSVAPRSPYKHDRSARLTAALQDARCAPFRLFVLFGCQGLANGKALALGEELQVELWVETWINSPTFRSTLQAASLLLIICKEHKGPSGQPPSFYR